MSDMRAKTIHRTLIVTLFAGILDTLMFMFNMLCQITLCCSLIITLITNILDTFMNRLNMIR